MVFFVFKLQTLKLGSERVVRAWNKFSISNSNDIMTEMVTKGD